MPPKHPQPLDLRPIKVHQQTNIPPRPLQIIHGTVRHVHCPAGPPPPDPQNTPHHRTFVRNRQQSLRRSRNSAKSQLPQQSPLINLLPGIRPPGYSNLKKCPNHPSSSASSSICIHLWPRSLCLSHSITNTSRPKDRKTRPHVHQATHHRRH
jgi:hypothetical protein